MKRTARARQLLSQEGVVVLPGVYDALSVRVAEQAGFPGAYVTGYGVEAALLGRPDIGLTTLTEVADQARRMAAAVSIPVFCDADTGFGGVINVYRLGPLYAATRALREFMGLLRRQGVLGKADVDAHLVGFNEFNELVGLDRWRTLEERCRESQMVR